MQQKKLLETQTEKLTRAGKTAPAQRLSMKQRMSNARELFTREGLAELRKQKTA